MQIFYFWEKKNNI